MLAAMMTAANLGARLTGWGFVVFLVGSVCWSTVGMTTGQTNLLATNIFLTLVNLIGIWRWLGRQRAYEDGGRSAARASRRAAAPTLFTATSIAGLPAFDARAAKLGKAVDALIECDKGQIAYVVIATGGIGGIEEQLRAIPRERIHFHQDRLVLDLEKKCFDQLAQLTDGAWPATQPTVSDKESA